MIFFTRPKRPGVGVQRIRFRPLLFAKKEPLNLIYALRTRHPLISISPAKIRLYLDAISADSILFPTHQIHLILQRGKESKRLNGTEQQAMHKFAHSNVLQKRIPQMRLLLKNRTSIPIRKKKWLTSKNATPRDMLTKDEASLWDVLILLESFTRFFCPSFFFHRYIRTRGTKK